MRVSATKPRHDRPAQGHRREVEEEALEAWEARAAVAIACSEEREVTPRPLVDNLPPRRESTRPRRSKALAPFPKADPNAPPPPKKTKARFKSVDEWAPQKA